MSSAPGAPIRSPALPGGARRCAAWLWTLLWAAASAASEPAGARGFFWKAESPTATVYLFGSVHAGAPEFYPLGAAVNEAYRSAAVLAVEADIRPGKEPAVTARRFRDELLPGGRSLREGLPGPLRELFDEGIRGLEPDTARGIERMPPWMAAVAIGLIELHRAGFEPRWGVDLHFLLRAEADGKDIVELEGIEAQWEILRGLPGNLQHRLLESALRDRTEAPGRIRTAMGHWRAGDAEALEREIFAPFDGFPEGGLLRRALYTDRNAAMAERIAGFLEGRRTVFAVLGAGHLLGDQGVPARLERAGFSLAPLEAGARPGGRGVPDRGREEG